MNDTEKNLVDLIEELNKAQKHKILSDIHYKKRGGSDTNHISYHVCDYYFSYFYIIIILNIYDS